MIASQLVKKLHKGITIDVCSAIMKGGLSFVVRKVRWMSVVERHRMPF
jgi:hypothetical protein